jgi:Ferritin-like
MSNKDDFMSDKDTLVKLLHEAAKLEHCLLDAYLYAACSLKSMPQEFATVVVPQAPAPTTTAVVVPQESDAVDSPKPNENKRRAIQYERVRAWKQSLLIAAREEMSHLHFVQCLLRALGEPPYFQLPERDEQGAWLFPDWQNRGE